MRVGLGARALALSVAAALSLAAPQARSAGNRADKFAAQRLLTKGNQLAGEGDYVGALEKFRAAYDKYPSPKILLNIGTTLRQLGRNVEAAEVYESYLADPEADASRRADLERILGEIEAVIGRVRIEVDVSGAEVRVDGKLLEGFKSGDSLRVEPGEHTVVASREDDQPAVQTVKVYPRQERLVVLRLEEPPAPPPAPPPPPSNVQRSVGLVVGGVGAAGIGTSLVLGILAKVNNDDASGHCVGLGTCDQEGVRLGATAQGFATASTVTFVIGTLALGAGIALLLTSPSTEEIEPESASLRLLAAPRPGGAYMALEWTW